MLTLDRVTYRIAGRPLLEDASAQVNAGWRVGLVGRNGAGKSTLLDLLRGAAQADGGTILLQKGARIGFLAQEAPDGSQTPLATVLAADAERSALLAALDDASDPARLAAAHDRLIAIDAHAAPARAGAILVGLGFDAAAQARPLASFSGGWRMRVALAAALFAAPDLLLLDEPTNHLDLEATLWLGDFLRRWRGTLLVVSHDRQFLDEVATHILHLADRRLTLYAGGFSAFLRQREAAQARQQALAAKTAAERQRLQAFIDRFRAKATKARQAQSRMKALARLEPVVAVASDGPAVSFAFPEPAELAPPLLTLDRVAAGYAPGVPVLRHLDLRLDPDDRIALLGANGNGKTTLARLLAGRLAPQAGALRRAPRLSAGYFAQHQIDELDPAASAFDHLAARMPEAPPEAVRARLARFGFGAELVFVPAGELSGGEKARLTFALITHAAPALLILDEPTNHLDIEARAALVAAINDFAGAVVIISHDWHLVSLTADRLWLVAEGTARPFAGDLEAYRQTLLAPPPSSPAGVPERRAARAASAERRRALGSLRQSLKAAETAMNRLAAEKAALEAQLAAPATYAEAGTALDELLRRQATLAAALADAEARWLAAAETLEAAEKS